MTLIHPFSLPIILSLLWFGLTARPGFSEEEPVERETVGIEPETARKTRPPKKELMKELTELQFHVTCENGTEPPFENRYWDNKKPGIYVDVISGRPLFSSIDKFASGTGWPSFTRPLEEGEVARKVDRDLGMVRIEVRSRSSDAHLGHVFDDGPPPTGLRYCVNSASSRSKSSRNPATGNTSSSSGKRRTDNRQPDRR